MLGCLEIQHGERKHAHTAGHRFCVRAALAIRLHSDQRPVLCIPRRLPEEKGPSSEGGTYSGWSGTGDVPEGGHPRPGDDPEGGGRHSPRQQPLDQDLRRGRNYRGGKRGDSTVALLPAGFGDLRIRPQPDAAGLRESRQSVDASVLCRRKGVPACRTQGPDDPVGFRQDTRHLSPVHTCQRNRQVEVNTQRPAGPIAGG